jgi:hypothetical protein
MARTWRPPASFAADRSRIPFEESTVPSGDLLAALPEESTVAELKPAMLSMLTQLFGMVIDWNGN